MKITEKFEIVSFITDQYLQESIRSIDNHFGEGYAKKNPELVSRMMGIMDNTSVDAMVVTLLSIDSMFEMDQRP